MSSPLVSAIIPCYNRPDYVREAIDSALAQTYPTIEIIVVDDGSTDETPQVLASYGDRIRVLRQQNAGTAAARNTGIAASSGKYLAWLDSDDAWLPEKIAAEVDAAERYSGAAVVYTRCQPVDRSGRPAAPSHPVTVPNPVIRRDILEMMVIESEVMPSSCIMRRDVIDEVGNFDTEYLAEDWDLHFRVARKYQFVYIDAPLTRYRLHDDCKSRDRWPHAQGLLKLRHKIEAARDEILGNDPTPAMRQAYERHRIKYADAYYRVGKLALDRGDLELARECLGEAIRLNPKVFKYYTRGLRARMLDLVRKS